MASTSTLASSFSYSRPQWTYDVFLSFRGKDTRNTFTGHLYAKLEQRGIDVYMDDRELERGKPIEPALWNAIEESMFSVVIFSSDYASSPWCLDELVKIVQCMKEMGQTVLPVFFDVDPSEVTEQQQGTYKDAFVKHEEEFGTNLEKMKNWKGCLTVVGNLSGWDVRNRNEADMIEKIVEHIEYKISISLPTISKKLVGIDSRLEVLNGYVSADPSDILFIGLCGMGGIGKTTIARVMYDKIRWQFKGSSFLANVRDVFAEKDGLRRLQAQLLSEILMEKATVWDPTRGINLIKRRLRHKKVLLILDDVDDHRQLEALAAEHEWFGPGSRIIITSRDKNVLDRHGVTRICAIEKLDDNDALMLFSWKAFKKDQPPEDFRQLSYQVVGYANGLPLALEVVGSFLCGREITKWQSAIRSLNKNPNREIIDVLRISFDGLNELEQKIFLDIACFFKGMKRERIIRILDACGFEADFGIEVLIEKSLLNVSRNEVLMHNLLEQMGKEIVRCESREEPERRSRLWTYEDVCLALMDIGKLTYPWGGKIESIFLDMPGIKDTQWNMEAFSKMRKLRLLKIHNVQLSEGPENLSNELRFLEWHDYPSTSLPAFFMPNKLVELDLTCSSIQQLWHGCKSSVNLKIINLSHSINLTETPDFSGIPNLETLIFEGCISLSEVHPTLGLHNRLQYVNFVNCTSLRSLPSKLKMESLRICTLDGCSNLEKFPWIEENMNCLMELHLDRTSIAELSSSIHHLVGLLVLSMNNCMKLKSIPNTISGLKSLKKLDLSDCFELENLPENLDKLERLEELDLSGTSIRQPPASIFYLKNLKVLSFDGCKRIAVNPMDKVLPSLSGLHSLETLDLCACNLEEGAVPEDIGCLSSLRSLDLSMNNFISLPKSINQLSRLEILALKDCRMLKSLPEVPSKVQTVNLNGCMSLTQVPDPAKLCGLESSSFECLNCWDLYEHNGHDIFGLTMLNGYLQGSSHLRPGFGIALPGSKIPGWFSHQTKGSSICVQVPRKLDGDDSGWIGFAACVEFVAVDQVLFLSCLLKASGREYYPLPLDVSYNSIHPLWGHLWLFYLSFDYLKGLQDWKNESFSNIELSFCFREQGVKVKNCGICLVFSPSLSLPSPVPEAHLIVATKSKEAASSSIASFSFSSYFSQWMCSVALSFRAEDSSNNFTPYLYTALIQRGITWEERGLQREEEIEPRLLKGIEESRISIIIFSTDYDCTSCCVDQLLQYIQYANHDMKGTDFPISFDIDIGSLDSNDKIGSCMIVFDEDQGEFMEKREKAERWESILTAVTSKAVRKNFVEENFLLQVLPLNEACELFEKMIGGVVRDSDFRTVAAGIVHRCLGLPVILVTVARALRGGNLSNWKDALEKLKRFDYEEIDQVYSGLELSYNGLRGVEIQRLFLLCAQIIHSGYASPILDLLKYTTGLGLFKQSNTLEATRHRLHKLVNDLKASCLLIEGDKDGEVKMYDVIRSFAVSIASKDHHMLTVADKLKEWPVKHMHEQCTTICVPYCNFPGLPAVFECPKVELFILHNKDHLMNVPDDLFRGMKKLKVMDMTEVHLSQLPSSLRFLENLRTLCLDRCDLGDMSMIGELRMLQVLSFRGSNIVQLPREIRQLTRLQLLDLTDNPTLQVIPPHVLSCLTRLEDLYMGNSFMLWEDEGQNKQGNNANLGELKHLQNLVSLDIHIINEKLLPEDLLFEKLERFRIFIGDGWDWSGTYKCSRTLKLKLDATVSLEAVIQMLLKKTEDLHLHDLKTVRSILPEMNAEGLRQLKWLHIQNSLDVQCIVDSVMMGPNSIAFSHLEVLSLFNLNAAEKICCGQPMAVSFSNLRILKVAFCHALKNLFSFSVARGLLRLEEISIIDCKILDGIVTVESEGDAEEDEVLKLIQLCRLTLEFLPRFRSIYTSQTRQKILTTDARMSNEIVSEEEVFGTPMLLFNKKILFLNLKELKLSSINVEKIWHNPSTYWFMKLTSLTVEDCGNLKYIFNTSMVRSLAQLKKLVVCGCKLMEEVIATEQLGEEQIENRLVFPMLHHLKLKGLPKLKRFCTCDIIKCPSLKELHMQYCPEMKTFVSSCSSVDVAEVNPTLFDKKVFVPHLEELRIFDMDHLRLIWHNEFIHSDSFSKLHTLEVCNGNNLLKIFPSNDWRRFKNLVNLRIGDCDLLEEVFDLQFLRNEKGTVHAATATQLINMDLYNLPNLKNVWNGVPGENLFFRNLGTVVVQYCLCLKSIFPSSVAFGLQQLMELNIDNCGVEVIVSKEEELRATPMFAFPKMTTLTISRLPELKSFYPGMHTSEWPVLKELQVYHCDKMMIYDDFVFPSCQGLPGEENQIETQVEQPLFSFTKIIPMLEELTLNSEEARMIKQGQFPQHLFDKLKVLHLQCFHDESTEFPFDVPQRFHNLEKLVIRHGLFKQLFSCGPVGDEEHARTLARIRHLRLHYLPNLEHIWDQSFSADQQLPNLGTLEVWSSGSLISLAPSTASFQNLTSLAVWSCDGLIYLITSSTARSLAQLTEISISQCSRMTQIVAKEEDNEAENEIFFTKLQCLKLDDLASLASFCSTNLTFKFLSLSKVIVTLCPVMETFTRGALSTPKLHRVWLTKEEDKGWWTGELNNTIQQLYTETNA